MPRSFDLPRGRRAKTAVYFALNLSEANGAAESLSANGARLVARLLVGVIFFQIVAVADTGVAGLMEYRVQPSDGSRHHKFGFGSKHLRYNPDGG